MTRPISARLPAALLVLAVTGACTEDFDPYSRLTSTRVLALRSEPVAPASGETTTLSALVYTAPGVAVESYAWSWCPFAGSSTDGYPCLVTEEQLSMAGDVPAFDLGHGETAALRNTIDPAVFQAVCAGMPGQPAIVDCSDGFPAQVKLVVRAGGEEVTTVRQLRLRFAAEQQANANPTIDGLVLETSSEAPLEGQTLFRRQDNIVKALVPATASETFTGAEGAAERERLILSWFIESGDIDEERTAYIDGVVALDRALINTWKPAKTDDYPRSTAALYVVVRDSRDGVTWLKSSVNLNEMTP